MTAGAGPSIAVTDPPAVAAAFSGSVLPRETSAFTRLLLACGIAGPVVFWVLGAVAALSWPGYSPISGSISSLIFAPEGWLQVDAFILMAALTAAFGVGMGRVAGATSRDRTEIRRYILLLATIELGFALFPTDPGEGLGTVASLHGSLHMLDVIVWAFAFPVLAWAMARILRRDPPWRRAGVLTDVVAVTMVVAIGGVLLVVAGPLEDWTGALERIWVAIPSLWLAGLSLHGLMVAAGRIRG